MFGNIKKSLKEKCIDGGLLNKDKSLKDGKIELKTMVGVPPIDAAVYSYYNATNRKERRIALKEYYKIKK